MSDAQWVALGAAVGLAFVVLLVLLAVFVAPRAAVPRGTPVVPAERQWTRPAATPTPPPLTPDLS